MLVLTRKVSERIVIADSVIVTVLEAHEGRVRLEVEAPPHIPIHRYEVWERTRAKEEEAQSKTAPGESSFFSEFA